VTRRQRKVTRSLVLFIAGLAGVALETFYSLHNHETPDSTLILLFSGMIGLPVYLAQDSRTHDEPKRRDDDDEPKGGRHVE